MSKIIPFQQIIFKLMDFMFLFFVGLFFGFGVFLHEVFETQHVFVLLTAHLSSHERISVPTSSAQ